MTDHDRQWSRAVGASPQSAGSQDRTVSLPLPRPRATSIRGASKAARPASPAISPPARTNGCAGCVEKPKVKCGDCPYRAFLPVTDDVIRWHLSGQDDAGRDFVMGVYPMLQDETCFFLAADFDKTHWQEDVAAVLRDVPPHGPAGRAGAVAIRQRRPPLAVLRGGHPRRGWRGRLGSHILTETMERRPDIGLDSYDRFFPNQDTLPQGGFGNLIALPLQKQARERGNSVFLDEHGEPYPDQWAFLASRREDRPPGGRADRPRRRTAGPRRRRAARLADEDDAEPWTAPPSRRRKEPSARRAAAGEPGTDARRPDLHRQGAPVAGPAQPAAAAGGVSESRVLQGAGDASADLRQAAHHRLRRRPSAAHRPAARLPGGCCERLLSELGHQAGRSATSAVAGTPLDVAFQGELRPEQKAAAEAMLAHDTGVLAATTAFGKTVVAAWLIAQRGVNTLVLVHRRQLLEQWVERLSTFLGLPPKAIGRIGGGRKQADRRARRGASFRAWCARASCDDCVGEYGHLIVDECHHLSAHSFEQVARRAKANSSRACPPPSRARTAITRSSSCSAGRCAIASTPRPRRPPGPSSTPCWFVPRRFARCEPPTRMCGSSSRISTRN